MTVSTRFRIISLALLCSVHSIAQSPSEQMPEKTPVQALAAFGQSFFKTHRTDALRHWMEKYRNSNSGLDGEWHTELHRGYRFEFIRGDGYALDELGSVVIADPTIELPSGIALGDPESKVSRVFGAPTSKGNNVGEYELSGGEIVVRFRYLRGRLIEVEVDYDHD